MDPHSRDSREFIDDILSQVTKMDFFGSKTVPSKNNNNPSENGKFFTVPVVRHVTGNDKDYLRKIPRVVW
jgi:hypothetical protein